MKVSIEQIAQLAEEVRELETLLYEKKHLVEGLTVRVQLGTDPLNSELSLRITRNPGHILLSLLNSMQWQLKKATELTESGNEN